MIEKIIAWYDNQLEQMQEQRFSCTNLAPYLKGYFPDDFLAQSYFIPVDTIPTPKLSGLEGILASKFIPADLSSLSFKNTYFVKQELARNPQQHCKELVHLAQWQHLGSHGFLKQLAQEIMTSSYQNANLIRMADNVLEHFNQDSDISDVPAMVAKSLSTS